MFFVDLPSRKRIRGPRLGSTFCCSMPVKSPRNKLPHSLRLEFPSKSRRYQPLTPPCGDIFAIIATPTLEHEGTSRILAPLGLMGMPYATVLRIMQVRSNTPTQTRIPTSRTFRLFSKYKRRGAYFCSSTIHRTAVPRLAFIERSVVKHRTTCNKVAFIIPLNLHYWCHMWPRGQFVCWGKVTSVDLAYTKIVLVT